MVKKFGQFFVLLFNIQHDLFEIIFLNLNFIISHNNTFKVQISEYILFSKIIFIFSLIKLYFCLRVIKVIFLTFMTDI